MKKLFIISLTILISACCIHSKERGYMFPENLETIITESKTKADLEKSLGTPSAQSSFGESVWIYYGYREKFHGPFPHTYDNKKALIVEFNKDKIKSTKILNDEDFSEIAMDSDKTKIPGSIDLNFLEELVGNVGRFSPSGIGQ